MDFALNEPLERLRERVRAFVETHVLPAEARIIEEDRAGDDTTLRALQDRAREEGLWVPHLPPELGGQGLGPMGMAVAFREMGRSLVGPRVFNCDAPDQGNMDLLCAVATPAQRARYLEPLVDGRVTSGFSMTEPAPGAGADPSNLRTRARRDGDGWVLDGHKWYTTGGGRAAFLIVMARTSDEPRTGATLFLVDRDAPGVEHVRDIETMSEPLLAHREAEIRFHGVRLGPDAVLGEVGQGFALAQRRLVPARLTHCMRWLGLGDRALEACRDYVQRRTSFGRPLAEHQQIQVMIARAVADLHAGNLMTLHCAWMLERGLEREARVYSSMTKTHVARAVLRLLDDAIQMHGGLGISRDAPFGDWYRAMRPARIVDGPDEVHVMLVAREWLAGRVRCLW
ncbi:MAG: acyl-CoA dehydrogenase family protein [Myxococcota bacterium]|nr:acyl-CoA dehydrogenase family protein [Myxococcota bacterium]